MKKRIGVIGIVVTGREKVSEQINKILSKHADNIIGRMGIPSAEHGLSLISLIVEGTPDEIGAVTGQLGNLPGVTLKSALTSVEVEAD
ncbi:TM1266 family iron-only hydrogenase system putative regulator [Halanaerobium salsuginis]|jgi:putative iron-only hydrogenase system regulator|uniref:Putative iron-only hydrogenase system regulator n=1 Tax=Halanaerobium salsuginis TaxID=29563 RepID=A0A1I4KVD0_9FIRM|nr:TM1266 family iron-only hydrogenase system putative regulator [Halanaerobium salsuginis]SFL82720.1 putative iron-only hydrogenase system regulator [Halanaerobium salsuginis]